MIGQHINIQYQEENIDEHIPLQSRNLARQRQDPDQTKRCRALKDVAGGQARYISTRYVFELTFSHGPMSFQNESCSRHSISKGMTPILKKLKYPELKPEQAQCTCSIQGEYRTSAP